MRSDSNSPSPITFHRPGNPRMNQRFYGALAILAALAALAWATLDGRVLYATWLFLGGIALKTWLSVLRDRAD